MINDAILLIDAGNSNIKWNVGLANNARLSTETDSHAYKNGDVYQRLDEFIKRHGSIRHAVVSNVAGEQVKCELQQCLHSGNNVTINFVQTEKEFAGIRCAYDRVENLGVDRWVSIIAAAELYLSNSVICIAGCGTATTVDFLSPDKQHLGGMISSGADLIRQQLGHNTANIPRLDDGGETQLFSTDTASAVISGARYAVAGMINTAVIQAQQQLGQQVQLLLTGGASQSVMALLTSNVFQYKVQQDTELLMKGLAIIASKELSSKEL